MADETPTRRRRSDNVGWGPTVKRLNRQRATDDAKRKAQAEMEYVPRRKPTFQHESSRIFEQSGRVEPK